MDALPQNRVTGAFERRVARTLGRLVLTSDAPLLVACSGGPDSMAALVASARSGRPVIAAHFNHRMRGDEEAAADRAAVEALAGRLGVPSVVGEGSGTARSEDDARGERYRWLASAAAEAGATGCVTGHTLDDQAETVLLRLVRGTGTAGASGMAETSPWPVAASNAAGLTVIRPLLAVTRADVQRYLGALGVEPRQDPSNLDARYSRNRLRLRVFPELRELNPRASEAIASFAGRARDDDEALEAWAAAFVATSASIEQGRAALDRAPLRALPRAVATRVLRQVAARLGLTPEASHLDAAIGLLGRRGAGVDWPGGRLSTAAEGVVLERTGVEGVDAPGASD